MQWSDNERKEKIYYRKRKVCEMQVIVYPEKNSRHFATLNKCRNSMLMTCHWPDLGRVSDWTCCAGNLLQPIRNTTQIWVVTRHQYGISALVSKTSFTEKPVVASPNISCFLRLVLFTTPKIAHVWWKLNYGQTYTTGFKWPLIINLWRWI